MDNDHLVSHIYIPGGTVLGAYCNSISEEGMEQVYSAGNTGTLPSIRREEGGGGGHSNACPQTVEFLVNITLPYKVDFRLVHGYRNSHAQPEPGVLLRDIEEVLHTRLLCDVASKMDQAENPHNLDQIENLVGVDVHGTWHYYLGLRAFRVETYLAGFGSV